MFYQKRRRLILDLFICLVFPLVYLVFGIFMLSTASMIFDMGLVVYIVQPARYKIVEDFGCRISGYNTTLSIVLVLLPRLAISLVSGGYSCKIISPALE
jgi:Pheromone A receptor